MRKGVIGMINVDAEGVLFLVVFLFSFFLGYRAAWTDSENKKEEYNK